MSEDEYWGSDPEFQDDDDELTYEFLLEEPDDLTLLMMPKIEFDLETEIDRYYKIIKNCKNKDQVKSVLRGFYSYVTGVSLLMNDIQYLQDRAKELEFNIKMMQESFVTG